MERGFTLIELAIVLVIIGLLVGGVLVGQDLIKSAQINATVSDLQSYTTGAVTFRDKYGGIPGDLLSSKASAAGLTISATSPGTTGEGDGDGQLIDGSGLLQTAGLGGETTLFWRQLSDAKMIPLTTIGDGLAVDTTGFIGNVAAETAGLISLLPTLRIRGVGFIHAYSRNGMNNYAIGQWTQNGNANGAMAADPILTGREAASIDQKLDDGSPKTGNVISFKGNVMGSQPGNGGAPAANNTVCYTGATNTYGVSSNDIADTVRCDLQIETGF